MAASSPSNRNPDKGRKLDTNQSTTISIGVTEINTFFTSDDPLILKVAKVSHNGDGIGQTLISMFFYLANVKI